jgi:hypothetical protein
MDFELPPQLSLLQDNYVASSIPDRSPSREKQ